LKESRENLSKRTKLEGFFMTLSVGGGGWGGWGYGGSHREEQGKKGKYMRGNNSEKGTSAERESEPRGETLDEEERCKLIHNEVQGRRKGGTGVAANRPLKVPSGWRVDELLDTEPKGRRINAWEGKKNSQGEGTPMKSSRRICLAHFQKRDNAGGKQTVKKLYTKGGQGNFSLLGTQRWRIPQFWETGVGGTKHQSKGI